MFYNRDWFGLFSSFRFHQFFKPDFLPRPKSQAPVVEVAQPNTEAEQSSPDSVKADTIETSQLQPDTGPTPVKKAGHSNRIAALRPYSAAEILKRALDQNGEAEENAYQPIEDKPYIQQRNWQNQVNMNLNFNLSEFEQSITRLVEDAEDGNIQTDTLNNINLGLHIDLSVKGKLDDKIANANLGQEGLNSGQSMVARARSASKQATAVQARSRNYEAEMFYRESQKSHFKIKKEYADGFLRVSRKLSMRYSQDFSFNFRSLQSYNTQAEQLSQSGDLPAYLNNTEAMVDNNQVTGDTIGKFFDVVEGYLGQAEDKLMSKINDFFDQLSSQLGIDAVNLDQSREQTLATAKAFFEKVDTTFTGMKSKYVSAEPEPPVIEEPPPTEPPDTETPPADDTQPTDQPVDEPDQTDQPAEEQPVSA